METVFATLLHLVGGNPKLYLTLDPIPFANACEVLEAPRALAGPAESESPVPGEPPETPVWALEEDKWEAANEAAPSAVRQAERVLNQGAPRVLPPGFLLLVTAGLPSVRLFLSLFHSSAPVPLPHAFGQCVFLL